MRAADLHVGCDFAARLEDDVEDVLGVAERDDALEFAPELRGQRAHERDRLQKGIGAVEPRAAAAAALDALPVVAADVVLPAHAHVVDDAEAGVVQRHLREAEVRREEAGHVREQLAARLERRGLEPGRGVVGCREGRLDDRPEVAVQRGDRDFGVVKRGQGDVDHVDVGVVQHVLDAAVGAHVGIGASVRVAARFFDLSASVDVASVKLAIISASVRLADSSSASVSVASLLEPFEKEGDEYASSSFLPQPESADKISIATSIADIFLDIISFLSSCQSS